MYIPEIYKNENQEQINSFINENGFAILVNQVDGKPWATHIPLVLDKNESGKPILAGHISKENSQAESLTNDSLVLAVFSGPHSYISSSWYDHENVPTWNYVAVHIYGKIKILNLEQTINSLKKLVDKYEFYSKNPVRVEELSAKTMLQARGIVGFEIEITEIQAVNKMSQNRDNKNYNNIILELEKTEKHNEIRISQEMKRNLE